MRDQPIDHQPLDSEPEQGPEARTPVVGAVLAILGAIGRAIGGRRHRY